MNVRIDKEGTIVILTGAGISRESGLDTFRCEGASGQKLTWKMLPPRGIST